MTTSKSTLIQNEITFPSDTLLYATGIYKSFTIHNRGGIKLTVLENTSLTTFSGGEKQRVNIARALAVDYPIFLLDEPTSALDAKNRRVVIELLTEKKKQGCALIGIFHDEEVKNTVCSRELKFESNM